MNDETKIEPCPYCEKPVSHVEYTWQICCFPCGYKLRDNRTNPEYINKEQFYAEAKKVENELITRHNTLCALIDKGRQCHTEDHHGQLRIIEFHLDTAVGLLGVANGLTFSQSTYEGHKCAKKLHGEVNKFLNLDAIKAILKQKGQ